MNDLIENPHIQRVKELQKSPDFHKGMTATIAGLISLILTNCIYSYIFGDISYFGLLVVFILL